MKAIGASKGQILRLYLTTVLAYGVLGIIAALAALLFIRALYGAEHPHVQAFVAGQSPRPKEES